MVTVYAIVLALGVIGLLVQVMGGALAENLGHEDRDPGVRFGLRGKQVVAAAIGFGMGGISAEFAPIDISWPFALLIAVVAAVLAVLWVRYAVGQADAT